MSPSDPNWIVIASQPNEALAELTKERLEAAGIPVVLTPGDASAYMGASSPFEIQVPKDKATEAKAVLGD